MQTHAVPIQFPPGGVAHLRELRGFDEELVGATDTRTAIRLLDQLLVEGEGRLAPGRAIELTAPDRDRVLAVLLMHTFGSRIESTLVCDGCSEPFDLDFSIGDILLSAEQDPGPMDSGVFLLPDGRRFRLPTGEDELAITGLPADRAEDELFRRALLDGASDGDRRAVEKAIAAVAPLIDIGLVAPCPECTTAHVLQFDIQTHLLTRVRDETRQRTYEIHRIAKTYGWRLPEILELTRAQRRRLVEMIERDQR